MSQSLLFLTYVIFNAINLSPFHSVPELMSEIFLYPPSAHKKEKPYPFLGTAPLNHSTINIITRITYAALMAFLNSVTIFLHSAVYIYASSYTPIILCCPSLKVPQVAIISRTSSLCRRPKSSANTSSSFWADMPHL